MIPEAALQIRHPENMLSRLAGLTVIERQLFTFAIGIHGILPSGYSDALLIALSWGSE